MSRHRTNKPGEKKNEPKTPLHAPAPRKSRKAGPPASLAAILWRRHAPWLALLALALAAYLPALSAGFIWDDTALTQNPLLTSPSGLRGIWFSPLQNILEVHYWPLVYTSFWAEVQLWGLHPLVFHLNNILLHALCAVLLWRLLRRLDLPGAWLAAALFAVHPVHAESVAWVIERKDVLSGAFYLGTALAWLRYERTRRKFDFTVTTTLFICALLCKSVVVTLPFALALLVWWRRGRLDRRDVLPLAILAVIALAFTAADLAFSSGREVIEKSLSLPARLQVAGAAFWFYLGKLAWPASLAALYPQWRVDPASPLLWLPLLAALAVLIALWALRGRLGRGPLVAALFFILTLSPALGLVQFYFLTLSWVADRFQYLASIGPIVLVAAGLAWLAGALARFPASPGQARVGKGFPWEKLPAAALILLLGVLTWRQAGFYHDPVTLFERNIALYPQSWAARYEHGVKLAEQDHQLEQAAAMLSEAARLNPDGFGLIQYHLAVCQAQMGKNEDARRNFDQALRLAPHYAMAYNDYGAFLGNQGLQDEAIKMFRAGLQVQPYNPSLMANLGNAVMQKGQEDEGLALLRRTVALYPAMVPYRVNLAGALAMSRHATEAVRELEIAVRLDPRNAYAHANLGSMLLNEGNRGEAILHLEQAVRLNVQDPGVYYNLGEAYRFLDRVTDALKQYNEALRLRPGFPEALQRKKEIEAKMGK